jgi:hypothetical protein
MPPAVKFFYIFYTTIHDNLVLIIRGTGCAGLAVLTRWKHGTRREKSAVSFVRRGFTARSRYSRRGFILPSFHDEAAWLAGLPLVCEPESAFSFFIRRAVIGNISPHSDGLLRLHHHTGRKNRRQFYTTHVLCIGGKRSIRSGPSVANREFDGISLREFFFHAESSAAANGIPPATILHRMPGPPSGSFRRRYTA